MFERRCYRPATPTTWDTTRYGIPKIRKYPFPTVYAFGQTELTFQNEWDDPCLIATTLNGEAMLRAIAADLGTAPPDRPMGNFR